MSEMNVLINFADCSMSNCRFCLRRFEDSEARYCISAFIEEKFEILTQKKLQLHPEYPQYVCIDCESQLSSFYQWHQRLMEVQEILQLVQLEPTPSAKEEMIEEEVIVDVGDREMDISMPSSSYAAVFEESISEMPKIADPFICHICDRVFKYLRTLNEHVSKVHEKIKNYFCDCCEYGSYRKNDLVRHVRKHVKPEFRKTFDCNLCQMKLKSFDGLKRHQKKVHVGMKTYECCRCGEVFSRASDMTVHLEENHQTRQFFGCNTCDNFFETLYRLKKHKKQCPGNGTAQ